MLNYFTRNIKRCIKNPYILIAVIIQGKFKFLSDETYLKIMYRAGFNEKLNLDNPITYNQKIQWLKLNDHNVEYSKMVDKYEVRKIVSEKIGASYLIPVLGIWENIEDVDIEKLPNQFVLKCTHDSGGVIICKNKKKFNIKSAKIMLEKSLKKNYFYKSREWPYKEVLPRIIAEQYIVDNKTDQLIDYKFFCFNGVPKMLYVASDRDKGEVKFDYFDMNFNRLKLKQNAHPNSTRIIEKPAFFDEMVNISKSLSEGIPHVRIDLYIANGKVYFGEYTFFHHSGMVSFEPASFDEVMGKWINLENF